MAKVTRVKYFTDDKLNLINAENQKKYDRYLKSNVIKNREVESTTYKVYKNNFDHFLVFLAENYNNLDLYSNEFMENAVDIMEDYMLFLQTTMHNNKKTINNKIASISSFYLWSTKRKLIPYHPFDKKLDRMKGAQDEHIINSYFLTHEQIIEIRKGLEDESKFDIQDKIIFEVFLESANRVGAISKLTLSSMNLDNMIFEGIREKRGYRVEVLISELARDLIEEWLALRKESMDNLEIDALFITKYKDEYKQMSYGTIQSRIKNIGKIVGIDDFHAHCMRKTKLNDIYETTGDLTMASAYANHKGSDVTLLYIKPKSKTELRDKIMEMMKNKENKED
jgi:integrase/recombinase XerC